MNWKFLYFLSGDKCTELMHTFIFHMVFLMSNTYQMRNMNQNIINLGLQLLLHFDGRKQVIPWQFDSPV